MRSPRLVDTPATARRRPAWVCGVTAIVAATMVLAGCGSSNDSGDKKETVAPATASAAPSGPAATPAGTVVPTPPGSTVLAHSGNSLGVLGRDGTSVLRLSTEAITAEPTTIAVPRLTRLIGVGDGAFVGAGPEILVRIGADGAVTSARTSASDPTALARTASGQILVGTANGHLVVFDAALKQTRDIGGFVGVDQITVSPLGADLPDEQVVVLDKAQSSVTPVNISTGEFGAALRAGNGATEATVDHYGRILVSNTRDDEIIGFFGSPLVMRFRYPVPNGPYAVDYDDTRNLLWVSTTANNEVVAYDLAGGEPVEKHRFAAVAQPDALTVDDASGTLYVLSARDGGVQVVTPPYNQGAPVSSSTAAPSEAGR
ncbi:YncE family protein [Gordonia sp. 852002-50395_SCH5434458]|uniref:YncE family protein n=1 Tax=Gordonia sp. 852002-50395_SCH5434458 TaxID=1834090 RepID=UPI0007E942C0|nr:hypothetical protein [Gordonia sp. 852002-50395_SCH5434458]OBC02840.1 hypothetical protein A5785_16145 [Gordonia sp. 852002-50395_SCH5434458]